MSRPADHQELDDLALRVLHGVADEAEQAALRELLRTKPEARHRFILQATQHAMLCREGAAGSLATDKRLYFERLEEDGQGRWWARKAWLAAAAVAADAIWTYLMTFGAPGVALILLWIFERRSLSGSECGAIPCQTIDIIIIFAGLVCLVSMAGIAFVLRSRSNAQRVGEFAQGAIGGVFRLVKRTPPNVVESVVGFNDTAAEMVGTRWVPITITNVLAQLTPMFVVLAALRGVGADSVTVLEVFAAFSVALLLTTVPLAPGGAGTVDAAHARREPERVRGECARHGRRAPHLARCRAAA